MLNLEKKILIDIYKKIFDQSNKRFFFDKIKLSETFSSKIEIFQLNLIFVLFFCEKNKISKQFSKSLINYYLDDMESAIREIGVSETSIGRKKRIIAENFYGRLYSYTEIFKKKKLDKEFIEKKLKKNFKLSEIKYNYLLKYITLNVNLFSRLNKVSFSDLKFDYVDLE